MFLRAALFVVPVVLAGWVIGWFNIPGPWYESLSKPAFNPPNWVFAPVWTILYLIIGVVGWRVFGRTTDSRSGTGSLRALWGLQLLLNYAWSPAFFGLESAGLALVLISLLLATILAFILRALPRDRLSAGLFIPYLAWVSFAALLNFEIWRLN
ncbi:TspO/MBR family protein [Pseudogemmobacter humi]|uniref:TspO/MBR family protein n=1 Tax=Pseudogemmobacter humi TaxID=2483812 RepID=A0A3P5X8H1_9RHOB|nr:TspO/MBR family protein [Pseudogemmobacter humi]VDC24687.1 TspO/MBR family protein [Pseudogemmobacter humi]